MLQSDKKKYLNELITKQINTVSLEKKLSYKDLSRITKYVNTSMFSDNGCCLWIGYVTNSNLKSGKGLYVNFYFENKKVALHRLLYDNFIGTINDNEYLKFTCANKGRCCNIKHLSKHQYVINDNIPQPEQIQNNVQTQLDNKKIEINFD